MTPIVVPARAVTWQRASLAIPWTPVVFVVGFVLLFLRRPETLLQAEFWADDGIFYQHALWFGPATVAISYAGYLSVLQRVVVLGEVAVPPAYAPLVGNLAMLVIMALVAAFLASDRMSRVLPDRRWRIALALLFVALPAGDRVLGTLSNIQWILGVYLIAMLVATAPSRGRIGDGLGMVVAGLGGAIGIILLPLYAIRAWRDRRFVWHLLWLGLAAAFQVIVYLASFRNPPAPVDWSLVPQVLVLRTILVPVTGIYGPVGLSIALPLAAVVGAIIAVAVARLPRTWLLAAVYLCLVIPLAGIRATEHTTAELLDPLLGGRYFYLTGVVIAGLVVVAMSRGRWLAVPALALLFVGVAIDFRMPPIPPAGWASASGCIHVRECVVPVQPNDHFAVRWP